MAILWCGGEDFDFLGGVPPAIITTAGKFRANYARCAVGSTTASSGTSGPGGGFIRSVFFPGGPVTSAWASAWYTTNVIGSQGGRGPVLGFSGNGRYIAMTTSSANQGKFAIAKSDGVTYTELALEGGASATVNTLYKIDIQVINYGTSATVNVYLNGSNTPLITFTGDVTVSGMTNLDSVIGATGTNSGNTAYFSEVIVADEDTRGMSLLTAAPNAAGTTDQWTGTFSNVSEITLDDSTVVTTNVVSQDEQFNLIDLPSGAFAIKAVVVAARAMATTVATATKLGLGINSGGTVNSLTPTTIANSFQNYYRIMPTNPVTGIPFTAAEINALQVNLRSG